MPSSRTRGRSFASLPAGALSNHRRKGMRCHDLAMLSRSSGGSPCTRDGRGPRGPPARRLRANRAAPCKVNCTIFPAHGLLFAIHARAWRQPTIADQPQERAGGSNPELAWHLLIRSGISFHGAAEMPIQRPLLVCTLAALLVTGSASAETTSSASDGAASSAPAPGEPFAFADFTWLTGNSRTKESPLATSAFTGEFRLDADYVHDFNHPQDDTIVGSSEIFRSGEVQITQLGVGGDFHYQNVRGRLMTQFGLYSQTTPRNDASPARGQWNLDNAYRYVSEAYGGYHFNVLNGINFDGGIFMSYVGLFSYYQFDNWAYQPSYVSSNTPWFFNGVRIQIFTSDRLKIEPWFINGWQSYGRFNQSPGLGLQVLLASERLHLSASEPLLGQGHAGESGPDPNPQRRQHPAQVLRQSRIILQQGCVHVHLRRRMRVRRRRELHRRLAGQSIAILPRLHGLQPLLVLQGHVRVDAGRRRHHEPRAVSGAAPAHQRRDRGLGDALLHAESRRLLQGVGRLGHARLHAESVRHVPPRREPPAVECALLRRLGRRDAPRRQLGSAWIARAWLHAG